MVDVVPATKQHARLMAPRLRTTDVQEVWATGHHLPYDALRLSVSNSVKSWTALLNEVPVVMWGVGCQTVLSECGSPWMLATDRLRDIRVTFLRESDFYIDEMLELFPKLENFVDARNKTTIRWLKWCGFTVFEPEPYGLDGLPFHRILLRRG